MKFIHMKLHILFYTVTIFWLEQIFNKIIKYLVDAMKI